MKSNISMRKKLERNIREVVFGLEDSLVSTLGTVTGIAAGTGDKFVVILSGIVLVFVEGLSMAAGSYLSSKSASEAFEKRKKENTEKLQEEQKKAKAVLKEKLQKKDLSSKEISLVLNEMEDQRAEWWKEMQQREKYIAPEADQAPIKSGVIMGFFYLVGGIFPLVSYLLLPVKSAILPSVILTAVILLFLGFAKAKIVNVSWLKSSLEMMTISLAAAFLGFFVGRLVAAIFNITVV